MIKTREQFEERLKKLREGIHVDYVFLYRRGYRDAIDAVLKMIEDEGGCFKE